MFTQKEKKMEYMEFLNAVCDHISDKTDDVAVSIHTVTKNNGITLSGLTFSRKGYNASPTIYMENHYEEYLRGTDISEIGDRLLACYRENDMSARIDMTFFDRFESVKDRLFIKLINLNRNKGFLEEVPFEPFLDLAIVAYVRVHDKKIGDGLIMVRNEHIDHWGVDAKTVLEEAKKNTHDHDGFVLQHILDVLDNVSGLGTAAGGIEHDEFPMYVATNSRKVNGAAVLTMKDKLREYAWVIGGDYYIIPSSVHELILLGRNGHKESYDINEMIREVNTTSLGPDDVLADHVYIYSKNDDVLIF